MDMCFIASTLYCLLSCEIACIPKNTQNKRNNIQNVSMRDLVIFNIHDERFVSIPICLNLKVPLILTFLFDGCCNFFSVTSKCLLK